MAVFSLACGGRAAQTGGLGAVVAELAQAGVSRLRHAALLYASAGEFAAGVAGFVQAAAQAGDPVLVACVRDFAASRAQRAGLPPRRVGDLVIAVGELAGNTLTHTSGPGTVTVWVAGSEIVCQVDDSGHITDLLAGRLSRDPVAAGGGRGPWVVQQACDLVQIRTSPAGTAIRLHMHLKS
jgi:anti-sigma regulatory factor (Ser/Thr protein kinase)